VYLANQEAVQRSWSILYAV